MSNHQTGYFGVGLPYTEIGDISGKLIVIEGTDGVGRSTQIDELKRWLEVNGYGVTTTGWARSSLMGKAIDEAKEGHTLNVNTYSLLYAADFADRLEHEIIPALKAGFIVLADRYIYTAFARALVRGADRDWIRKVYGFALQPHMVFYMTIELEQLVPRVINGDTLRERYWADGLGEGLNYWESGMDLKLGEDFYDSFLEYQRRILAEFDRMTAEYGFQVVSASRSYQDTNRKLKEGIEALLNRD